jgi:hypothetical protein
MKIRNLAVLGVCALAVCVAADSAPRRARAATGRCAAPAEVAAQQASALQQELMVAALACGDTARDNYNAFQTRFGPDLRVSDQTMLQMFKRVMGARNGDKAYNLFKTELAAKAELRRTHDHEEFCQGASILAAAALGPTNQRLASFVGEVPPAMLVGGVAACETVAPATTPRATPARRAPRRGARAPAPAAH